MFNDRARIRLALSAEADPAVMPRLLTLLQTRGIEEADITLLVSDLDWRGVTLAQAVYRDDTGECWIAWASNDPELAPDEWDGFAEDVSPAYAEQQIGIWLKAAAEAFGIALSM